MDFSTLFSAMPTQLDLGHATLSLLIFVITVLFVLAKNKVQIKEVEKPIEVIKEVEKRVEIIKEVEIVKEVEVAATFNAVDHSSALQILSLLQQEGRFIDFIQQDLTAISNEQLGAAARVVHAGSQKVIQRHLNIKPIMSEQEQSQITIAADFDRNCIRLTGQVTGEAPYHGTLIHKGWQVSNIDLPKISEEYNVNVLANAEVEL